MTRGRLDSRSTSPHTGSRTDRADPAVGKQTLTGALPPVPAAAPATAVQRRVTSAAPAADPAAIHAAAAHGTSASATALPHLPRIQALFGRHDISGIQAHVGAEASAGARAMGAEAFATGNRVAFDGMPSLHTAAHEAAHVVQQRAGVHLAGGVGREGDVHEQHADAVADAVVQGKSAEALLDLHAPSGGGAGQGGAVQALLGRGSGWNGMLMVTRVDNHAKAIWDDIDRRFNTDLPDTIKRVEVLSKKSKLEASKGAGGVLAALRGLFTTWDGKSIDYGKAKALQGELTTTLEPATDLLAQASEEELALEQQRQREEEEQQRQEELARQQAIETRSSDLTSFESRLGTPITKLKFVQNHKPPIDERRELLGELTRLRKESRGWGKGEKASLEARIRDLENRYEATHKKWEEEQARKKSSTEAPEEVVVELSDRARTYKQQSSGAFSTLSRACGDDAETINAMVAKFLVGDLGRVTNSLRFVSPEQWLELRALPGVEVDPINQLLTQLGQDRFEDAKAMFEATAELATLIELVTLYKGDPGNKIVPVLERPGADARKVHQVAKQSPTLKLLDHLAKTEVVHTDVHTLLAGDSKDDVAFLIEQLPESALLVKLETTIADPLELRLLVKDLGANGPGLLAVKNLYAAKTPPKKSKLYDAVAVKTARGLRTNAGGDIATATMSSLTGTKEQAGAQATVDHVRGGGKPTLTHPTGAKFGDDFDNSAGPLPGVAGAGGYKEYYVEKDPGDGDYHGSRRIVVSNATSHIYYTSNHYTSFVRLLV